MVLIRGVFFTFLFLQGYSVFWVLFRNFWLLKVKAAESRRFWLLLTPVALRCQQYPPQMFLDNLSSSMQGVAAANTSAALLPSASGHYDGHIGHQAQVIARGRTDGSISDIISLD